MCINTDNLPADVVPLFYKNEARFLLWRERVETFKATQGARELLGHVSESEWFEYYAANDDAFTAVVSELARID